MQANRTVYLIFQPAEESGQGAARCADLIREKGIREIYAFHNLSGYPETRNHEEALEQVNRKAAGLQLPIIDMKHLWRASEDFGYYLKACPGAMFYIGNGEEYPAVHTEEYDFNDHILETAVNMFLALTSASRSSSAIGDRD